MKTITELIADSKSTFVSRSSFVLLVVWLGFLFVLRYLDIGMPESLVPINLSCTTMLNYNITAPNLNPNKAESCPVMDYWNELDIGIMKNSDKKILITTYNKIDKKEFAKLKPLMTKHGLEYTAVFNGTIYAQKVSDIRRPFHKFTKVLKIDCFEGAPQCEASAIISFKPKYTGKYTLEYRISYLTKGLTLNHNLFSNTGVMVFNKNYMSMLFWSKIVNLAVLGFIFVFFSNGVKKLGKDELCVEQKYIKQLALMMFMVNEPITSWSMELS
jgi:hypothetical protein